MGPLQYELFASGPVAINRMFAIFHAQFPKLEQNHIVRGLVVGALKLQLLFVTVYSIWYWFDVPNIKHVIHISVPHTIKSV